MSQENSEKLPLLRQPTPGWRRVLHKLWLTLFCVSILCPLGSIGFELYYIIDRRAADRRLLAIPSGMAGISTLELERIACAKEKAKSDPDFDPFQFGLAVPISVSDFYREGNNEGIEALAKLPGSETWTDDWDKVRWEGTRYRWEFPLGFLGIPAFLLLLRLWLGWLSR